MNRDQGPRGAGERQAALLARPAVGKRPLPNLLKLIGKRSQLETQRLFERMSGPARLRRMRSVQMSKHRTDSRIPWLPALRIHCMMGVTQRAVMTPPPESRSRRTVLKRLALLVGGSVLLSAPIAFARNANKPIFVDQRSSMRGSPRADRRDATLKRPPFSEGADEFAGVPGMPSARFWADSISDFEQALPQGSGPWLICRKEESTARTARVLSGWTKEGSRPVFSVVAGTSTGALMAPYAFLGADYDDRLQQDYTTATAADILELRVTRDRMFDDWPLAALIAKIVTPEMLRNIAKEHQRGRRLFVVMTNLDAARPVTRNMGVIAARGGEEGLRLFDRSCWRRRVSRECFSR